MKSQFKTPTISDQGPLRRVRNRGLWIGLLCLFGGTSQLLSQDVQPIVAEMIRDSVVDQSALNFPNGPFGTCINGQTFQQEAVVSFKGYQYAGYFAEGGVLCVARRQLSNGPWQVIRFDDYSIHHNDVHNVVVIGICHADGTVHLAFDQHGHPLHYRQSVPQLALKPDAFEWSAEHFGKTVSALEPGKPLQTVTYPQFFSTPRQTLQLLYRLGSSGNGDWHLAEYDPDGKGWSHVGMVLSRQGEYNTSSSRCAYPNPIRYGPKSRLHMTWCWRERPRGGPYDLRTNHDVCYAYSDDFGRTWMNNEGRVIAALGGTRQEIPESISLNTPGIVVQPTRYLWGQMNTTTEFVDSRGRVHVINWQHQQDATTDSPNMNTWRYYHYWCDADGQWHENRLPFYGRKPQIILDKPCTAFVVYCKGDDLNYHGRDPGGQLRIAVATEKSGWTDWRTAWESRERFVGEPLIDQGRWNDEEILSVYVQKEPKVPGAPSALHVRDFRMSNAKSVAAEGNGRKIERVPAIDGPWWQVASSPALPEIGSGPGEVVDHCFFKAKSGKWQLWTQIRGTEVGRLFYRWEARAEFERPEWEPKGICWRADRDCGESFETGDKEFIHAPFVFQQNGNSVMYYGGGPNSTRNQCQMNVATSSDGVGFSRYRDSDGHSAIFTGPGWARDPLVLRVGEEYFLYYCGDVDGEGVIALRMSTLPVGRPWSQHRVVSRGGILGTGRASQQCPFVVYLDGYFYLFKMAGSSEFRTAVYRSEDPRDFGSEDDQLIAVLKSSASEIIRVKDQFYISSLIPGYQGVRVAHLRWDPPLQKPSEEN